MKFFELKMRVIAPLVVICCFVFFGSQPAPAQVVLKTDPGTNNPPPAGAILDLSGTPIPTGSGYGTYGAYQRYTVNFVADITNTAITFAFREDPARISLANASVTDLTHPSGNLLVNGDFSGGMYNSNGNGRTPNGWTYANIYGVLGGGACSTLPVPAVSSIASLPPSAGTTVLSKLSMLSARPFPRPSVTLTRSPFLWPITVVAALDWLPSCRVTFPTSAQTATQLTSSETESTLPFMLRRGCLLRRRPPLTPATLTSLTSRRACRRMRHSVTSL